MASRKPYECFRCRDNGFPNTMVYLTGEVDQVRKLFTSKKMERLTDIRQERRDTYDDNNQQPIQLLLLFQQLTPTVAACGTTNITESSPAIKVINAKLDRIINLLVE